ncbi:MAG: glutamate 5-kinase [Kosmotoga sp.]|nr:MAG: glutamate 5-kinase [Kosmotoga sp.]
MSKIVIKIGSNLLVDSKGKINKSYISDLSRAVKKLLNEGNMVVLVTSGARAAGYGVVSGKIVSEDLYVKQALCSIGQVQLMKIYETIFDLYNVKIAQLLITRDDFSVRKRFLNLRNTLIGLLEMGFLPIVNENDTLSTDEITFGDNDILASMFSIGWQSDYLFLLTTVDGVFDKTGKLMNRLDYDVQLREYESNGWGTGGIKTKIRAAKAASATGVISYIVDGKDVINILRCKRNEKIGTKFPARKNLKSRKAWIGFLSAPKGEVEVNRGAEKALRESGSLLPVGIVSCSGKFERGDIVEVLSINKEIIGRGITNFTSEETTKIMGYQSNQLSEKLGYSCTQVFIHADNFWKNN